ncbi:hypothetical protein JXA80_07770 [bacterium]|nr:hypothetical protein [candidate division CSSED10-310 bacterium]
MCKDVAAVLYGVGARLDEQPSLLFTLRKVDAEELIHSEIDLGESGGAGEFADDALAELFGIEIDDGGTGVSTLSVNDGSIPHQDRDGNRQENGYCLDENGLIVFSGAAIQNLRKQFGLTQAAFAKQIRTSMYYLRKWEADPGGRPELDLSVQVELETLVKFGID